MMGRLCIAMLIVLTAISYAYGVSISISASNNGESVVVEHYYYADDNANYKARGNGAVNFQSLNVEEKNSFKAQANESFDWNKVRIKANHLIKGDDYAIAKVHVMIDGEGNVSENNNFNAGANDCEIKKELKVNYKESMPMVMSNENSLSKTSEDDLVGIPVKNVYSLPQLKSEEPENQNDEINTKPTIESAVVGDGETIQYNPPGDYDYVMVAKGNVEVTKHAKDLMPYDIIFGSALQGSKVYSYGIWLVQGVSTENVNANSESLNYNYNVSDYEGYNDYCVWNGTGFEGNCYWWW